MNEKKKRRLMSERINAWLEEDAGALFKTNKWRFWYIAMAVFQLLIGIATYYLYPGQIGAVIAIGAALLVWLAVSGLHYTDSGNERMDKYIAIVDAFALLFAACHLAFMLYAVSHHEILKSREANYEKQRVDYNDLVEKDRARQVEKAKLEAERAKAERDTARLEADTAYWEAKRGGKSSGSAARSSRSSAGNEEKLESFEKPKALEGISAADFLAEKDAIIRLLGGCEFLIAVISLILIRWLSVRANHSGGPGPGERDRIPDHLKDWWNSPEVQAQQALARETYANIMKGQAEQQPPAFKPGYAYRGGKIVGKAKDREDETSH